MAYAKNNLNEIILNPKNERKKGMALPEGLNNCYILMYRAIFENKTLSMTEKGVLFHLHLRAGKSRLVKGGINKLSQTLNIPYATYNRAVKALQKYGYIKILYPQKVGLKNKLSSMIYINPIIDETGAPIQTSEEEYNEVLSRTISYLNEKYKNSTNENYTINEDKLENYTDLIADNETANKLTQQEKDIFVPIYLAFFENRNLSLNEKIIYSYMKLRAGADSVYFESRVNLYKNIGASNRIVDPCINSLFKKEYFSQYARFNSITGKRSSDVYYIYTYDKFTGLPNVDIESADKTIIKLLSTTFSNYNIKRRLYTYSDEEINNLLTNTFKDILFNWGNYTSMFFDTFIEPLKFILKDDTITIVYPSFLSFIIEKVTNELKEPLFNYINKFNSTNIEYKLLLKPEEDTPKINNDL